MCLYMFKALEGKLNPYPPGAQFASYHRGTSSPWTRPSRQTPSSLPFGPSSVSVLPDSCSWSSHPISFHAPSFLHFSVVVQLLSHVSDSLWPCDCSMPGFPVRHHLLELAQTHVCWVSDAISSSNHLILCHPLLLLPSVFPSIRVFSKGLALRIRWPKYWSISFSISPSNEYSGLNSLRTD